jgi:ankyrin repeat protein
MCGLCVARDIRLLLTEGAENPSSRNQNQDTPLHTAALNGHVQVTRVLLEHGADPFAAGSGGWLPLNVAVVKQHTDVVEVLSIAMRDYRT